MPVTNLIHGLRYHELYGIYVKMMYRCYNKKSKDYILYGARGIKVVKRWHKIENFMTDMSPRPKKTSIDRIDNNKNYSKENCRWATIDEQARNKRSNIIFNGETARDASVRLGNSKMLVVMRIRRGWSLEKAFTTPIKK